MKQVNRRGLKFTWLFFIIALTAFGLSEKYLFENADFAAMLFRIAIGLGVLYSADRHIAHKYDTLDEIKNGNIAAAVNFLAYAIVVAAGIIRF